MFTNYKKIINTQLYKFTSVKDNFDKALVKENVQ